jgi:hypothetical protein
MEIKNKEVNPMKLKTKMTKEEAKRITKEGIKIANKYGLPIKEKRNPKS